MASKREVVRITYDDLKNSIISKKNEKAKANKDEDDSEKKPARSKRPALQIYRPGGASRLQTTKTVDAKFVGETEWDVDNPNVALDNNSQPPSKESSMERNFSEITKNIQSLGNNPHGDQDVLVDGKKEHTNKNRNEESAKKSNLDNRRKKRPDIQVYVPRGRLLEKEDKKLEENWDSDITTDVDNMRISFSSQDALSPKVNRRHLPGSDSPSVKRSIISNNSITSPTKSEKEQFQITKSNQPKYPEDQYQEDSSTIGRQINVQDSSGALKVTVIQPDQTTENKADGPTPSRKSSYEGEKCNTFPKSKYKQEQFRKNNRRSSSPKPGDYQQRETYGRNRRRNSNSSQEGDTFSEKGGYERNENYGYRGGGRGRRPKSLKDGNQKKFADQREPEKKFQVKGITERMLKERDKLESEKYFTGKRFSASRHRAGSFSSDMSISSELSIDNFDDEEHEAAMQRVLDWGAEVERELSQQVQNEAQKLNEYLESCVAGYPPQPESPKEPEPADHQHPKGYSSLPRNDYRGRKKERRRNSKGSHGYGSNRSRDSSLSSNQDDDNFHGERRGRRPKKRHSSAGAKVRHPSGESENLNLKITLGGNERQVKMSTENQQRKNSESHSPQVHSGGLIRLTGGNSGPPHPHSQGHGRGRYRESHSDTLPRQQGRGRAEGRGQGGQRMLFDPNNPKKPIVITNSKLKFNDPATSSPTSPETDQAYGYNHGYHDTSPGYQDNNPQPGYYNYQQSRSDPRLEGSYDRGPYSHSNGDFDQLISTMSRHRCQVVAQQLLHEALQIDNQLTHILACRVHGEDGWRNIHRMRHELKGRLQQVLLLDPPLANKHSIEQLLWKSAYYQVIEVFRKNLVEETDDNTKAQLLQILQEGTDFFEGLVKRMQAVYNFDLETFLDANQPPPDNVNRTVKLCLVIAQKLIICLGDISRYREQANETTNYGRARSWYMKAQQLAPKNGRPYNQLAILALYTRRKLDAVYYYMRSLAASNPFITARESLMSLFDEARKKSELVEKKKEEEKDLRRKKNEQRQRTTKHRIEIWVSPDGSSTENMDTESPEEDLSQLSGIELNKRFVLSFLTVHGKLFTKIGMELFAESCGQMLQEFSVLLQHSPCVISSHRLLQLMAINMFAIENTALKDESLEDSCRSLLQDYSVQMGLDMFGLLCARCAELMTSHLNSPDYPAALMNEDLHQLTAGVKVWTDWMMCHAGLWNPTPMPRPPDIGPQIDPWKCTADLCNILKDVDTSHIKLYRHRKENCDPIILSEDNLMAGFVPMLGAPVESCFIHSTVDKEIARDSMRLEKLGLFSDYLCGIEPPMLAYNVETKQYYSVAPVNQSENEHAEDECPDSASDDVIIESEEETETVSGDEDHVRHLKAKREHLKRKVKERSKHKENVEALLDKDRHKKIELEIHPRFLVPDTNCFIDHFNLLISILESKKYTLVIPLVVINELDGLAKGSREGQHESREHSSMVQQHATTAVQYLESQFQRKNSHLRAQTSKGSILETIAFRSEEIDTTGTNDDLILSCCLHYCKDKARDFMPKEKDAPVRLYRDVVLLTDDRNLRLKAHTCNVPVREVASFKKWSKIS
ncbi:hypothetical protein SNE40_004118 [Patella caerulea]|uniref:PIN domain-containing protein n=2 Tax=Patella caerulea TaxID=87958 RepID=A0AAN8KFH5_PATCE